MKNKILILLFSGVALLFQACEESLDVTNPSQLDTSNVFTTQTGVEAVLYSAYLRYDWVYGFHEQVMGNYEYPCDILYETSGGMNANFVTMSQFQWTPSNCLANDAVWTNKYGSIRDANSVIDNISNCEASESVKKELLAEARYIRAVNYIYLYDAYGGVPLRTSEDDDLYLARSSEEDVRNFIVSELEACAEDLPNPGEETVFGRATKGGAYAFLARFYLNNKEWQNCLNAIQDLEDLNYYELFSSYTDLFKVGNEPDKNTSNKEMIVSAVCTNVDYGNKIQACAQPSGFAYTNEIPGFVADGIANWAAQFRIYDDFYDSFETGDERLGLIYSTYVNKGGATINLAAVNNNRRTLKFFDNDATAGNHGADFPMIRYADILLMKAEALNEVNNGPTTESVALVNQVRERAGLEAISSNDYSTKDAFNDHILDERGWEFYYEGLRRSDLIRHGKFISSAQDRGVTNAQSYHVKFPIPEIEMDSNENMVQNDGY